MSARRAFPKVVLVLLGLVLGACILVSLLLWLLWDGDDPDGDSPTPTERLTKFGVESEAVPVWTDRPDAEASAEPATQTEVLDIYLDVSRPMGGFLPPEGEPPSGEFRTVVQWVPDHLLRAYRRDAVALTRRDVGADIGPRVSPPLPGVFERSRFDALSSRLDLALETMLGDVRSGRAEASALVTDLVGTGESTGALALSKPIRDWLRLPDVRTGALHLGLLAVKATYWGAEHPTACPLRDGIGCRFSERLSRYVPLKEMASVPFYVLIAGSGEGRASQIGEAIRDDAFEQGVEVVWELLTAESRTRRTSLDCSVSLRDGEPQYALFVDEERHYECRRDEPVRMDCVFGGEVRPTRASIADPDPAFEAEVADGRIVVDVDCAKLRDRPKVPTLGLTALGTVAATGDLPPWGDWSTTTDEADDSVGRTLQLQYFIEDARLRPDEYRIDLPPLLRGAGTP